MKFASAEFVKENGFGFLKLKVYKSSLIIDKRMRNGFCIYKSLRVYDYVIRRRRKFWNPSAGATVRGIRARVPTVLVSEQGYGLREMFLRV